MRMLLLIAFALVAAAPAAGQTRIAPVTAPIRAQLQDRVGAAIVEALVQRMGADARIIVERLAIASVRDVTPIEAVPDPGARTGEVVTFALLGSVGTGASRRVINVGRATALVRVEAPHAKTVRLITRGEDIEGADLQAVVEDVPGVPLRRLPTSGQLVGGQARRNIAAGEIATTTAIAATKAVRSGQLVRATATIAGAQISATLVAAQGGELGAVIRVVNRESRRELRARVVGEGSVEVIYD
jgi:flagella basal body P-ring formation protein FlgA